MQTMRKVVPLLAFLLTKIWRVKNIGEVPWPAGTRILFVGGDQLSRELVSILSPP